ncbi:hypothetical protein OsccyDRAFT_3145 [Leptolyngbyaceae cyanobacterium JSC-12]|nr:hypothetical protein OsccyDRAFT_3145 [Leptolyngbyaceae cyanobacterium JSC-12]
MDAPILVLRTWQLIRQYPNSVPKVIAESVLSYDLGANKTVVSTNRSGIYLLKLRVIGYSNKSRASVVCVVIITGS